VFAAQVRAAFERKDTQVPPISAVGLERLKDDPDFVQASQFKTTSRANVLLRLARANELLFGDL